MSRRDDMRWEYPHAQNLHCRRHNQEQEQEQKQATTTTTTTTAKIKEEEEKLPGRISLTPIRSMMMMMMLPPPKKQSATVIDPRSGLPSPFRDGWEEVVVVLPPQPVVVAVAVSTRSVVSRRRVDVRRYVRRCCGN